MRLRELFSKARDIEIKSLSCDSRLKNEDGIFFCLEGRRHDGHNHIEEAIKNGATVIVYSREIELKNEAIYIRVDDVAKVMNKIALKFYHEPSKDIRISAVMGDYGKSTIISYLRQLMLNYTSVGTLGSFGVMYHDVHYQMHLNTDVIEYLDILAKMRDEKIEEAIVELDPYFINEAPFDIFNTKFLIYAGHSEEGSEEELVAYKKMIDALDFTSFAIVNKDDPYTETLIEDAHAQIFSYGFSKDSDLQIFDLSFKKGLSYFSLRYQDKTYQIVANLISRFNVYNLVAALSCLILAHYDFESILPLLKNMWSLNGRGQRIDAGQSYEVIVDRGQNPTALKDLYRYASTITSSHCSLVAIFGIAGFKDEKKMASIAGLADNYCDKIILTEEDPRQEDPILLCEKLAGHIKNKEYVIVQSRLNAIEDGVAMMNSQDTLLILGKGEENYMYRSFGKENYQGDANIVRNFIKKRMEEENEIS